jgi:hypothetical protein
MLKSVAAFDPSSFDDSFLASPGEIFALLAQLACQGSSRPPVPRVLLEEFLSHQPSGIPHTPMVEPRKSILQKTAAVTKRELRVPLRSRDELPSGRPVKNCQCGHCRRCLDNARWDRIFSEKFACPEYYPLTVRHDSSLA